MNKVNENESLHKMLKELDIEQIQKVRAEFMKIRPNKQTYNLLCLTVINEKREELDRKEFIALIEEVKKESAPDSAATPSEDK